jgi:hypothetical protein
MTSQGSRGDVDTTVTRPVAISLLARAGFAQDDRGRWTHADGCWTWATDEALRWALVTLAEDEPQQAVARASEISERERERRADFGAAAVRAGTPDFGQNDDDGQTDLGDALANVMHFARRSATDFDAALETARLNFTAETEGEATVEAGERWR